MTPADGKQDPTVPPAPEPSDANDALVLRCRALSLDDGEEPNKLGGCVLVAAFALCALTVIAFPLAVFGASDGYLTMCFGLAPALAVPPIWYVVFAILRPNQRGQLILTQHALRFTSWNQRRNAHEELTSIRKVGRQGRRIQIAVESGGTLFFWCPRLSAEDMYDALLERLEELGVEFTEFQMEHQG